MRSLVGARCAHSWPRRSARSPRPRSVPASPGEPTRGSGRHLRRRGTASSNSDPAVWDRAIGGFPSVSAWPYTPKSPPMAPTTLEPLTNSTTPGDAYWVVVALSRAWGCVIQWRSRIDRADGGGRDGGGPSHSGHVRNGIAACAGGCTADRPDVAALAGSGSAAGSATAGSASTGSGATGSGDSRWRPLRACPCTAIRSPGSLGIGLHELAAMAFDPWTEGAWRATTKWKGAGFWSRRTPRRQRVAGGPAVDVAGVV